MIFRLKPVFLKKTLAFPLLRGNPVEIMESSSHRAPAEDVVQVEQMSCPNLAVATMLAIEPKMFQEVLREKTHRFPYLDNHTS